MSDHMLAQDPAVEGVDHEPDRCAPPAAGLDHVDRTARIDNLNAVEAAMLQAATDLVRTQTAPVAFTVAMPVTAAIMSAAETGFLDRDRFRGLELGACGLSGCGTAQLYGGDQECAGQRCGNEGLQNGHNGSPFLIASPVPALKTR